MGERRATVALGLMSGTSADGVTAAVIRIDSNQKLRVIDHRTYSFSASERERIRALGMAEASEVSRANMWLGERFATAAQRMLRRHRVSVIGSHGQTVWHEPGQHTLQLGEPSVIAERTGVTVVADFRPRDIAAGGEGAPLVPYFDTFVFGHGPHVRAVQNIGGIANVCVVGGNARPLAFDTGPGNALIDEAVCLVTRGRHLFDRDGKIAASGALDRALLERLLEHPYFRRRPPKSTGRELFSRSYLVERCGRMLARRPADVIATLTFLTARSIADAYHRFVPTTIREVVLSGGGAFNRTLKQHLDWLLFPAPVRSSAVYGIHPMAKEAAAFALLAVEAVRGRSNTVPWATGARHPVIAGKIVPGSW